MDSAPILAAYAADAARHADCMLGDEDRTRVVNILESSLRVLNRNQFYLWDQGVVQALLPHDILICGVASSDPGLRFHRFCVTRYFRQECFEAVCEPADGLISRLLAVWHKGGGPVLICAAGQSNAAETEIARLATANEMRNLAAHGTRDAQGRVIGYFIFSRVGCEFGPRLAYLLELLTPIFQATFARVLFDEQGYAPSMPPRRLPITQRQIEILKWIMAGKRNAEIASMLTLSPWTVKNHVRAIMKRLDADNRSHALARAISLGILKSSE